MVRFSSLVDDITFQKIKNGTKTVKFYLYDIKRAGLSVGDSFSLLNQNGEKITVLAKSITISKDIKLLVEKFSLKELGEAKYNSAYFNVKKWFSDQDIEKCSVMAVSMEIINE